MHQPADLWLVLIGWLWLADGLILTHCAICLMAGLNEVCRLDEFCNCVRGADGHCLPPPPECSTSQDLCSYWTQGALCDPDSLMCQCPSRSSAIGGRCHAIPGKVRVILWWRCDGDINFGLQDLSLTDWSIDQTSCLYIIAPSCYWRLMCTTVSSPHSTNIAKTLVLDSTQIYEFVSRRFPVQDFFEKNNSWEFLNTF